MLKKNFQNYFCKVKEKVNSQSIAKNHDDNSKFVLKLQPGVCKGHRQNQTKPNQTTAYVFVSILEIETMVKAHVENKPSSQSGIQPLYMLPGTKNILLFSLS